jgi:hypothetical protein
MEKLSVRPLAVRALLGEFLKDSAYESKFSKQ